jgi:hypothetical protein
MIYFRIKKPFRTSRSGTPRRRSAGASTRGGNMRTSMPSRGTGRSRSIGRSERRPTRARSTTRRTSGSGRRTGGMGSRGGGRY